MLGRVVALLTLVAASPVYLIIAIAVRLCDGGRVLYGAERLGLNGKPFVLFKFRTMRENCEAVVADLKTVILKRDPRVTAVGRCLRCGFDELPQVLNVFRGEMLWVGPRPDPSWMLDFYGPVSRQRLAIKPGITGLAQVLDSRNLDVAEMYALDLWFLEHRTFVLELGILVLTPLYILGLRVFSSWILTFLRRRHDFLARRQHCETELSHFATQPLLGRHHETHSPSLR